MGRVEERERGREERKETLADKPLACKYSRFSLLLAAWDVLPGGTSAPQRQKCHINSKKSREKIEKILLTLDSLKKFMEINVQICIVQFTLSFRNR